MLSSLNCDTTRVVKGIQAAGLHVPTLDVAESEREEELDPTVKLVVVERIRAVGSPNGIDERVLTQDERR